MTLYLPLYTLSHRLISVCCSPLLLIIDFFDPRCIDVSPPYKVYRYPFLSFKRMYLILSSNTYWILRDPPYIHSANRHTGTERNGNEVRAIASGERARICRCAVTITI